MAGHLFPLFRYSCLMSRLVASRESIIQVWPCNYLYSTKLTVWSEPRWVSEVTSLGWEQQAGATLHSQQSASQSHDINVVIRISIPSNTSYRIVLHSNSSIWQTLLSTSTDKWNKMMLTWFATLLWLFIIQMWKNGTWKVNLWMPGLQMSVNVNGDKTIEFWSLLDGPHQYYIPSFFWIFRYCPIPTHESVRMGTWWWFVGWISRCCVLGTAWYRCWGMRAAPALLSHVSVTYNYWSRLYYKLVTAYYPTQTYAPQPFWKINC